MAKISASDVAKLRKATGAGMMDCKTALNESNGDFDKAIEIIRKKGIAVASKRADREATEGVVLAKSTEDHKEGAIIALNCETDFVAKNDDFVSFANLILDKAINEKPENIDELKALKLDDKTIEEHIIAQIGIIGEKIELSYFDKLKDEKVWAYIHADNKLASLVAFNKDTSDEVANNVAMQVAAMSPIALDKDNVPKDVVEKELEIGKEQAKKEGKPDNLLDKIAMGKLNKFFKESTLLNQQFIRESKMSVSQYIKQDNKELTVTGFKRYSLKN